MSQEATLIFEIEPQIPFTVADGTAITRGTLLKITDPMTAIKVSGANDAVCGIAGSDKIASDGTTTIGVYLRGIFKMFISGNVTVGDAVVADVAPNFVKLAVLNSSGSQVLGHVLETATTGETAKVLVDVYSSGVSFN